MRDEAGLYSLHHRVPLDSLHAIHLGIYTAGGARRQCVTKLVCIRHTLGYRSIRYTHTYRNLYGGRCPQAMHDEAGLYSSHLWEPLGSLHAIHSGIYMAGSARRRCVSKLVCIRHTFGCCSVHYTQYTQGFIRWAVPTGNA